MVVNIRGTNGSGKTHLVRQWLNFRHGEPFPQHQTLLGGSTPKQRVEGYRLSDGGWIVGSYQSACGGCDRIHTRQEVEDRIRGYLKTGALYVLFEGLVITGTYEPWLNFSKSIGGMIWVFLDTPYEVCLQRVYARNKGKAIKEDYVMSKFRSCQTARAKAEATGEHVIVLPYKSAFQELSKLLQKFGRKGA